MRTDWEKMSIANQMRFLQTRLHDLKLFLKEEERLNSSKYVIESMKEAIDDTEKKITELEYGKR